MALLVVPPLVGQLLFGAEPNRVAVTAARVAGIALIALGVACWLGLHLVGMLTYSTAVTLHLVYVGFVDVNRHTAAAGGRPARDPDGASEQGDEDLAD